ncbi:MAG: hypothetical protein GY739_07380 [Mesoflavibacter sp.]|nr:hypothetical protein [Mesoflavibacter sp.]
MKTDKDIDKLWHDIKKYEDALKRKQEELTELIDNLKPKQCDIHVVSKSLPSKEEILFEPISNALYATNRFTTDQCTDLANGIIQYIDDYKIDVKQ